jgi:tetratricopeptide (TPR) repeat protein
MKSNSILAIILAVCASPAAFAATDLAAANADLQAGKADQAIALLQDALKSDPQQGEANNLMCQVEMTIEHFDDAVGHCEKAVAAAPQNARYHLWLGRALGERARRASFMSAYSLAKRTRAEFETAVKLDPHDTEALSDLGEFYEEAPGVVGGGMDKAEGVAKQLEAISPALGHEFRAGLLDQQKDFPGAEKEFKSALAGPHPALVWMSLASFYRRHERWDEMESAIASGAAAAAKDKHAAAALENGASILVRANRQPAEAIKLYESYLASPDKTEDAPAFAALVALAKLRQKTGDIAGAKRDRDAALALAHDYKPAQELKL